MNKKCLVCGKNINKYKTFCSPKCYGMYRKGKTYEEIYGPEKAKEMRKKIGKSVSKTRQRLFKEGKLTVWNKGKKGVQIPWNKGIHMWKTRPHPRGMLGKKHKPETILKIKNSLRKTISSMPKEEKERKYVLPHKGERNINWKGGTKPAVYPSTFEKIKKFIRFRDNFQCKMCGEFGNNVHHIDYNKQNSNPNNLITLCVSCHSLTNYNRDRWKYCFENPKQFFVEVLEHIKTKLGKKEKEVFNEITRNWMPWIYR